MSEGQFPGERFREAANEGFSVVRMFARAMMHISYLYPVPVSFTGQNKMEQTYGIGAAADSNKNSPSRGQTSTNPRPEFPEVKVYWVRPGHDSRVKDNMIPETSNTGSFS